MKTKHALSLLFLTAAACSSVNPYVENRLVLEESVLDLHDGRYQEATVRLEKLLAETGGKAATFPLQRFFAAYLLTEAHGRAGHAAPFLDEPGAVTSFATKGARKPSRLAHLMAMTYHSGFGRSSFEQARSALTQHKGESKLPPELEEFGAERAFAYLNLCLLAVNAELDFQDRIDEFLSASEHDSDLEHWERLMDDVAFPEDVRPWVYLAVFEYWKQRDERLAYRFAIRARETGAGVENFGEERREKLARWVTDGSSFRFVSPANQPFDPALEGCTVTGTPNLMYEAVPKQP